MEIKKERKNKRKIIITLLALALAGAVLSYIYFAMLRHNDTPSNSISKEVHESDREQSSVLQENPENKDQAPNTDHPTAPSTTGESSKKQVQMVASTDQSGGTVFIRGGINYPVAGGSCYAQLSGPSGQSIRKDSTVLQNPASTDCKTISIPTSELAPGSWTFVLHYTSDEYEGASDAIPFTI